jgi:hypothetical protein
MSVLPSDIGICGVADMPEADGVTVGGAPDLTKKVTFTDISPAGTFDYVSSSNSDTATKIEMAGLSTSGNQVTETVTLNGTAIVAGSQIFERALFAAASGASAGGPLANPGGTPAVGDIAAIAHTRTITGHTAQAGSANSSGVTPALFVLQAGDGATLAATTFAGLGLVIRITGGTGVGQLRSIAAKYAAGTYGTDTVAVSRNWSVIPDATSTYDIAQGFLFDLLPNQVSAVIRAFATVAANSAGAGTLVFYEAVCVVNNNTATTLTSAAVEIASESGALPSGELLDLGLAAALDDTTTIANRQTAPAGISFTTQPSPVSVPVPGNLPSGAAPNAAGAQKAWLRYTVPAGSAPYKGALDIETTGVTT